MPIKDIRFERGVFYAVQEGYVDTADAQEWSQAMQAAAESSPEPIVILVNALAATSLSAEARRIFSQSSETPNIKIGAVATLDRLITQQSRMTALMSRTRSTHDTYFFDNLEDAWEFALKHAPAYD